MHSRLVIWIIYAIMNIERNDDMTLNIRGNKIEITDAIKSYIEEKLRKLDKYFENSEQVNANVVVRLSGIDQIIEVTIPLKKVVLRAEERAKDLYVAIDIVSDKLERQIRKNKTRMHHKNNKETMDAFVDFTVDKEEQTEETIVKRKKYDAKPMSEEEAMLQMSMLGHDFFIFKDSETNRIAVLYRRKDGNFGIIEMQ